MQGLNDHINKSYNSDCGKYPYGKYVVNIKRDKGLWEYIT